MANPNPGSCPICGTQLEDTEEPVKVTAPWGTMTLEYFICSGGEHIIYVETVPPSEEEVNEQPK